MRERDVQWVVDQLNAERVTGGGFGAPEGNINFSCLLAPWTHEKGSDSHPSMGINFGGSKRSLVHCFGCGFGGPILKLLDVLENYADHNLDEIRWKVIELEEEDQLRELSEVDDYDASASPEGDDGLIPGVLYEQFSGLGAEAANYMHGRGFSWETLLAWGVGFDVERHRVTFPLRNRKGQLAGALGRTTRNEPQRWHTYWGAKKARHLFGAQLAVGDSPHLVVVEGPCDALRVWQETRTRPRFANLCPVAIMGSKPSRRQVELIRAAGACTFFLDNDSAGTAGTHILVDTISNHVPSWVARYADDRKDPDSLGADVVAALDEAEMV